MVPYIFASRLHGCVIHYYIYTSVVYSDLKDPGSNHNTTRAGYDKKRQSLVHCFILISADILVEISVVCSTEQAYSLLSAA